MDERGVDLLSGKRRGATDPAIVIGQPGANGLSSPRNDSLVGTRGSAIYPYKLSGDLKWYFRASFETFSVSFQYISNDQGFAFTLYDTSGSGWKLQRKNFGEKFTLTSPNGMVVEYDTLLQFTRTGEGPPYPQPTGYARALGIPISVATSMAMPDGLVLTYHHDQRYIGPADSIWTAWDSRVQSVTTNYGYQLKHTYAQNGNGGTYGNWIKRTSSTLINNAVDYCDPNADSCSGLTQTWPTVGYTDTTYTDTLGNVTTFTTPTVSPFAVTSPTGIAVTYTWDGSQRVTSVANGTQTYNYAYADSGDTRTVTITGPASYSRVVTSTISRQIVLTDKDSLNRTTSYAYNSGNLVTRVTAPEGNYVNYTYDSRGNVTETRAVAKSGSGLANIVTTASYDATCTIPVKCDKPNYTIDARGGRTDYTYDTTHGGVLTVTAPAPSGGAARPQTRYAYTQLYAWMKNSGGTIVQAATPIYKLTGVSACTTGTSCAGTASEVKTAVTYGAVSVANNLLPTSVSSGAGDGSLTATVTSTHDHDGNPLTVDGPLAGAGDTTRYRFDALRRSVGIVGPDPDGAGALKHRAVRTSYNADGQPVVTETGTVDGYTDLDWAAFVLLDRQETTYDALGRAVKAAAITGGVTQAVAQLSYDAAGRPECAALRMNAAIFGSLPASACTLGTAGANGPDRITKTVYDAADQVLQSIGAFGTALQQTTTVATYSTNGQTATVADAKGNLTTYVYDGFDRLSRRRYPVTTGSGSSTTDYEEYTYDAASNAATERRRDGTTITYSYDALSRRLTSNNPATTFAYDNLGRLLSATTATSTLSWTHDALNRPVTRTDAFGTWGYQYDLAGQRTRITWPDAYYATYAYDLTGAMTVVGEAGGPLATYLYDDRGRRTGLTRANGTSTTYGYDAASRLNALASDLAGSGEDSARGFTHSLAGQILQQSESNALYIWAGTAPGAGAITVNGLNQLVTVPGATVSHDAKGNISAVSGGATYAYDAANRLTAVSGGTSATLSYDALGRLAQIAGAATTRFAYDGGQIIGEYDGSGAMLRRYIPGAAADETLVWYEGAAFSARRFLVADERGSVIAVTDNAGASLGTNTYDEYGRPGATNIGRFQYTGQAYVAEIGLYYYKARFYAPELNRFLQPDPIGYAGGMNLYAYVGGDPIGRTDPSGALCQSWFYRITNSINDSYYDSKTYTSCDDFGGKQRLSKGEAAEGGTGGSKDEDSTSRGMTIVLSSGMDGLCATPDGDLFQFRQGGGDTMFVFPLETSSTGSTDIAEQYGFGKALQDLGAPTIEKRGGVAGGGISGRVTSPLSATLRPWTGYARASWLKRLTGTTSIAGSIGRLLPLIGSAVMVADALSQTTPMSCTPLNP